MGVSLLVVAAGAFAAADAALSTASRARVDALMRAGRFGARALSLVVAERPRHINLLLLLRLGFHFFELAIHIRKLSF